MKMACKLAALTFITPFRRQLMIQLLSKQCRYCCYPHKHFHTSRLILQDNRRRKRTVDQALREERDKIIDKPPGTQSKIVYERLKKPLEGTHSLTIPLTTYRALQFHGGKNSQKLNYSVVGNRKEVLITGKKEDLMEFQDEVTLKLKDLFQFCLPLNDFQCMKIEMQGLGKTHDFSYTKYDGTIHIFKRSQKSCEELLETMKNILKDKGITCPNKVDIKRVLPDKFGITENTHPRDRIESLKSKLHDRKPISQPVKKIDSSNVKQRGSSLSSTNIIVDKDSNIPDGSARVLTGFRFVLEGKKESLQQEYGVQITFSGNWKTTTDQRGGTFLSVSGAEDNVRKCKLRLIEIHDSTYRIPVTRKLKQYLFDKKHLPKCSLENQHNVYVHEFPYENICVIGSEENVKGFYKDLQTHIEEARKIPELKKVVIGKGPRKEFSDPLVFDVTEKDLLESYNKTENMIKESTGQTDRKILDSSTQESKQRLEGNNKKQRLENVGKIVKEAENLAKREGIKDKPDSNVGESVVETKVESELPKMEAEKIPRTEVKVETKKSVQGSTKESNMKPKPAPILQSRPPVVTIMGHVDHGKTTLLDALRKSNVVSQEFGGITQHIGAFQVKLKSGNVITFLDTPGHAAFTNMRSRGASMTDIIVLVVAAEDGIMNQTIESIKHAKKAKVPVIVAINKIDLPSAEPEKVKYELANHGIVGEELGGDVQIVLISALKGTNLDELQENIIAQSEVLDLKADNICMVEATIIESRVDIGRGIQATALIQKGTLKKGNYLIAGTSSAKVRAMLNEHGKPITVAPPGTPVVVTGWDSVPSAGEQVIQVENEGKMKAILTQKGKEAKEALMEASVQQVENRRQQLREDYEMMRDKKKQLHWREYNAIMRGRKGDKVDEGMLKFPVILKADVDGSLEVIYETLNTFYSDHIEISIVSAEVGNINEGDYELAKSTGGRIYGFNVKENEDLQKKHDVPVIVRNVIYDLFNCIQEDIEDDLPTVEVEREIGKAEVLALFEVTDKDGDKTNVAGCKCVSGILRKDGMYRVVRNGETIYEGPLVSMKRLKKDVNSITEGTECGLGLDTQVEVREGDELICLEKYNEKIELDWNHGVHHIAR